MTLAKGNVLASVEVTPVLSLSSVVISWVSAGRSENLLAASVITQTTWAGLVNGPTRKFLEACQVSASGLGKGAPKESCVRISLVCLVGTHRKDLMDLDVLDSASYLGSLHQNPF